MGRRRAAVKKSSGPFVFCTVQYTSGDWESAPLLPENIIDALVRHTTLDVRPTGENIRLDSPAIFNYPFCWLTGHLPVRFTAAERENLKRYVERGGFIMVDDHSHDINGTFHKTVTQEIERVFGRRLKPVPDTHELYRSFFVYPEGAPHTQHELNGYGDDLLHQSLYAIEVDGRIGLLYSNKDYSSEWNYHPETNQFSTEDIRKFAVNLVAYALSR
jgi:hypothetical protein